MAAVRMQGRHYRTLGRMAAPLTAVAGLMLFAALFMTWIHGQTPRPLTVSLATRVKHVSVEEVSAAAAPYLAAGFFRLDMRALQSAIEQLPWVAEVQVRRRWPDGAVVYIAEREPVASWDGTSLLTRHGRVFTPPKATLPAGLPALAGPKDTERLMLQSLGHFGEVLAPAGLRVAGIRIDDRGAWSVELDTGMAIHLGRTQIEERLRRFADVTLPTLGDRLEQVAYVDLRYGSGFAVGWKEKPPVPEAGEG